MKSEATPAQRYRRAAEGCQLKAMAKIPLDRRLGAVENESIARSVADACGSLP
jgi:hypothetical protein